jgi:hypothetical protein
MKNTTKLKIATMLSFLLIIFPDNKLFLVNFIFLFISLVSDSLEMCYTENQTHILIILKSFFISAFTVLSILFIFAKNKYISLVCIIIQYSYLIYLFDISYIQYWYYILPTFVFVLLSLTLLYFIFVKKQSEKTIDS